MVRGGGDDEAESRARRADEAPPSPCRAAYSARTRDLRSVPELLGESLRPSHGSPRAMASVEVGIALGLLTTDATKPPRTRARTERAMNTPRTLPRSYRGPDRWRGLVIPR